MLRHVDAVDVVLRSLWDKSSDASLDSSGVLRACASNLIWVRFLLKRDNGFGKVWVSRYVADNLPLYQLLCLWAK